MSTTPEMERLLAEAKRLGIESEGLRQEQLVAARRRQEAILSLSVMGLSIRDIANRLDCSPAIIQASIRTARGRRPHIARREERIPYELHLELGLKLHKDEESIRKIGRAGLQKMRSRPRNSIAEEWLEHWQRILEMPPIEAEAEMLADTPLATELRQLSPFAGALTEEERLLAIRKAASFAA